MPRHLDRIALGVVVAVVLAACSGTTASPSQGASSQPSQAAPSVAASASAGPTPLAGCVPACVHALTVPGDLAAGEYQTVNFFGGRMQVTLQGQWSSHEDSTGEFQLSPTSRPADGIYFWEDVYPVDQGARVDGVPLTVSGILGWLQGDSNFVISAPEAGSIGAGVPATVVDLSIAAGAVNDDPGCPVGTCLNFLGFPQWNPPGVWGIAGTQVQRIYLADVSYGGVTHLFVVVIYPDDPANMDSLRQLAEPMIGSVRVPVE